MAERISKGTRKHIRNLKRGIRHEVTPKTLGEPSVWEKTEKILSLSLPNYPEVYAPNISIIREFFMIRIETGRDPKLRTERLKEFMEKHGKEKLDPLRGAFVKITDIMNSHSF